MSLNLSFKEEKKKTSSKLSNVSTHLIVQFLSVGGDGGSGAAKPTRSIFLKFSFSVYTTLRCKPRTGNIHTINLGC